MKVIDLHKNQYNESELLYKQITRKDFLPRLPELRNLSGWYDAIHNGEKIKFKISCEYKDFFRASNSRHFRSCFNAKKMYRQQPILRLTDEREWAVLFRMDKRGDILCRAWVRLQKDIRDRSYLVIYNLYGNGLSYITVFNSLHNIIRLEDRKDDVYLE